MDSRIANIVSSLRSQGYNVQELYNPAKINYHHITPPNYPEKGFETKEQYSKYIEEEEDKVFSFVSDLYNKVLKWDNLNTEVEISFKFPEWTSKKEKQHCEIQPTQSMFANLKE